MIGSFTYHQAAPGLILFTCWNAAHDGCGCHSVTPDKFSANIEALERMGYVNRTARREGVNPADANEAEAVANIMAHVRAMLPGLKK